jgi:protein involved in polysaccharide export with SLBB domain
LQVDDYIVVRSKTGFNPIGLVSLQGQVKNKGEYALSDSNFSLYDLFKVADGFLDDAYLPGISVTRKIISSKSNRDAILEAIQSAESGINNTSDADDLGNTFNEIKYESINIGIDGEKLMNSRGADLKNNIVLNTITVLGEVQQSAKITYRPGLTVGGAIRAAGGLGEKARKSRVYVVYQNGAIKSRRSAGLGLIRLDPKLEPGATVVVPEKLPREGGSVLGEIVGYTSTLATLALLIQQLGI